MVLTALLCILPGLKLCTSILEKVKEDVMKIQQQNTRKTVPNFKKNQEHIAGLQVKLNALVSMFHVYSHSLSCLFDYSAQFSGQSQG